jgi:peptidoglycan biosynthesis protein MviN/MurJ (putative lipid II flippase)
MKLSSPYLAARSALLFWRNAPHHGQILHAMLSVSLFVTITKFIGAAKEMAVAAAYGTSPVVDAYLYLTNLLNLPASILSGITITILVPYLVRLKPHAADEAIAFKREFLGSTLLAGFVIALVAGGTMFCALSWGITGLPPQTASLAKGMLLPVVLTVPFGIVAGFLAANVMAQHRQTNTLLEGVPALCIFVLLWAFQSHSSAQLAWATLAGVVVQLVLLLLVQPVGERLLLPILSWQSSAWHRLMRGFGILLVGQGLASVTLVVDQIMVAPLGPGAIATLGYASRLNSLLIGLGATAIARALLPVLSELDTSSYSSAQRVASRWMVALFLVGIAVGIAAWGIAPWGIRLLFQRGAFTAEDTAGVVQVFRWGVLQFPFYFAALVVVQLITISNDYSKFIYIGGINLAAKFAGNFFLIPVLGISGAQLATALMHAVSFLALWLFSRK